MPLRARRWPGALLFLALSLAPLAGRAQEPAITVRAIEVRGNRRIESSTIRFYIQLREGQALTSVELVERLRSDVKRIYGLGFFRDVRVDVEPFEGGLRVIYVVREKPVVSRVEVVGQEKLSLEKVRGKITVKVQTIVNEATLKESVRNIRLLYQEEGYFFARVEALLQEVGPDAVSVTFRVDEGEWVIIESINFTGNESVPRKDLLKAMETSEGGFFSWLTGWGVFQERVIRQDLVRLRFAYQNRGFVKVQVGEPVIREDRARARLHISIPIVEGLRYRVGRITLRGGEAIIPPEELRADLRLREGEVFDRSLLVADVQAIAERFAEQGHAFADVGPDLDTRDAERRVDVRINVAPGRRVFIGRVNIRGNARTRDNVVRREFQIPEGSLYDVSRLRRSRLLIERLNYFEEVKVVERRRVGVEDILDIDIEVKEKPTGAISGGVGFSSRENMILGLGIREENLFGRGWLASLDARFSSLRKDITASFTDPNFQDRNFSLGGDVFFRTERFDDFDTRREGGLVRVARALTPFVTAGVEYELTRTTIENIAEDASERVRAAEPEIFTSALTPFIRRDSRDSRLLPSRGALSRGLVMFAGGPLGGDQDSYLVLAEHNQYFPIGRTFRIPVLGNLVWSYRGQGRYTDAYAGQLPIFDRLFLGGATTVRGFRPREVGPRDKQGNAIGGYSSGLFSTSLRHPLVGPVHFLVFLDAGNVWQRHDAFDVSDLRSSVGFGFRFLTPVGPIRVDVGYKLDRKEGEAERDIHFGIGAAF